VFCASLADVFDNRVPKEWRLDLWHLITQTPELDWLLLTKRPENIAKMIPWRAGGEPWSNVWLGTTCRGCASRFTAIGRSAAHSGDCEIHQL
jgi:protein gp37